MIDGRLKIYRDSPAQPRLGATCEASSGEDMQELCLTFDESTYWSSLDSIGEETLTIMLAEPTLVDCIWLRDHNFKAFAITYGDPVTQFYVKDRLADSGENPDIVGIATSNNKLPTSYFEVKPVYVDRINITIFSTFDGEEKRLTTFVISKLMGEFSSASKAKIKPKIRQNNVVNMSITNKASIIRGKNSVAASVAIQGTTNQNDQYLLEWIFGTSEPFIFWPCGGLHSKGFAVDAMAFRLEDIYRVFANSDYAPEWVSGIYRAGIRGSFDVIEAI